MRKYKLWKVGKIYRGAAFSDEGSRLMGSDCISFDGKKVYVLFTSQMGELTDEQKRVAVESDPTLKFALYGTY